MSPRDAGLIDRLARSELVDALVVVGSGATGPLLPDSDLDLLIVLAKADPPLLVGLATVGGRVTDLLFATRDEVASLLAADAVIADSWSARVARWVGDGRIVHDASGTASMLRERLASHPLRVEGRGRRRRDAWFRINFDLAHNRRYHASGDETRGVALRLRLLYAVFELLTGWFALRELDWPGEKAALHYLAEHDEPFRDALIALLDECDPDRRFERYERLATDVVAGFGGTWNAEVEFQFRPEAAVSADTLAAAERLWAELLAD